MSKYDHKDYEKDEKLLAVITSLADKALDIETELASLREQIADRMDDYMEEQRVLDE